MGTPIQIFVIGTVGSITSLQSLVDDRIELIPTSIQLFDLDRELHPNATRLVVTESPDYEITSAAQAVKMLMSRCDGIEDIFVITNENDQHPRIIDARINYCVASDKNTLMQWLINQAVLSDVAYDSVSAGFQPDDPRPAMLLVCPPQKFISHSFFDGRFQFVHAFGSAEVETVLRIYPQITLLWVTFIPDDNSTSPDQFVAGLPTELMERLELIVVQSMRTDLMERKGNLVTVSAVDQVAYAYWRDMMFESTVDSDA